MLSKLRDLLEKVIAKVKPICKACEEIEEQRESPSSYSIAGPALTIEEVKEDETVGDALKPLIARSVATPFIVVAIGRGWRLRLCISEGRVKVLEVGGVEFEDAIKLKGPALLLTFPAKAS